MRIGLDIDDCLADFMGGYQERFKTDKNPHLLQSINIGKKVNNVLRYERDFWLNLTKLNTLNFNPTLYCTKRVNPKNWTKQYLDNNDFPKAPVYQMLYQYGNKATMIKGKVDVFVDDSIRNMVQMNLSGVPCLLYNTQYNQEWGPVGRIYSLDKDEIEDAYFLFKTTIFPDFKYLVC